MHQLHPCTVLMYTPVLGHLPVICHSQTMTSCDCSLVHLGGLQRVHDGDIQSSVSASHPVRDEDVSWSSIIAREEGPVFSGGA